MPSVVQIELPDVLPDVPSADDPCVRRLLTSIGEHAGVGRTHVVEDVPAQLCLHYDPERTDETRLQELAEKTGRRLTEQFRHATWDTPSVLDPQHAQRIEKEARRMQGVVDVKANAPGRIRVEYNRGRIRRSEIRGALVLMGLRLGDALE